MSKGRVKYGLFLGYGSLFAFAFFFFFSHLDNRPLWGDEAETALLAKNILRFGVPKTVDGMNHITVLGNFRDENAAHLWTWAPWLPEYLVAGTYRLFGETTWVSRISFAMIGWLSVILFANCAFRIYRDHRIALGSAFLLTTSEIFLLQSRQCRYYAVTVFAEILLLYGAFALLRNRKQATWLLLFALVLQFYTNFIVAAANLPLLVALGWFTRKQRPTLIKLALASGLFAFATLPWLMYARSWQQSRELIHENSLAQALYYCTEWQFHFIPWSFLLLPVLGLLVKARFSEASGAIVRLEQSLSLLIFGYFIILLLPRAELRYLLPLLPVGCLLAAAWTFRYSPCPIASGLLAIQAATNLIAIATSFGLDREHQLRFPLFQFVGGLNQTYRDRFTDIRDFFSKEARPGETVLVRDPEFPLIFYTGLKIIDARLTTPESLPDWILPQSASGLIEQNTISIPDSVKDYYEPISIRVHDSDRLGNVPEPDVYQYRATEKITDFLIYRKKS